jgi:hypothetical protein
MDRSVFPGAEPSKELPILFIMTFEEKKALLEKHGYTVDGDDTEEDLDHTIKEDLASGIIKMSELV